VSGATDHLPRLLALVPWLMAHPGTPVADIAREFEVTEAQLRKDLDLIWMCGLPGYGPGDLIDIDWHGDRVTLSNAEEIARPLRLTAEEATALVTALRIMVSDIPGVVSTETVDRALAKLEAAAGTTGATDRVVVAPEASADSGVITTVSDALARGKRLRLRYWVPARDEATDREVDPLRLFTSDGSAYLKGWCHAVGDLRTFKLDRILEADALDTSVDVPDETRRRALDSELFTPSPEDRLVTFSLDSAARWVADYYPCESIEERGDGGLIVALRVQDEAWVRRLALGLAGMARVTDPPDLAAEIRAAATATLAAYRE
jgi:proteasome accessory factor C